MQKPNYVPHSKDHKGVGQVAKEERYRGTNSKMSKYYPIKHVQADLYQEYVAT